MVKNELSIRVAESYRLAKNVANNKLNKYKNETQKNISKVLSFIDFNSQENDEKLQASRIKNLDETLNMLIDYNPYLADIAFYENCRKENILAWSFVNLDRKNPNKEQLRKKIALHRQSLVKIDNEIELAKFKAKLFDIEFDKNIQYKKDYYASLENLYKDNSIDLNISYETFIENTNFAYEKYKETFKRSFLPFYEVVKEAIKQSFINTSYHSLKATAFEKGHALIAKYKESIDLYEKLLDFEVDKSILKEQAKEKLDIAQELAECEKNIQIINEKLAEIKSTSTEEYDYLEGLYESIVETTSSTLNIDFSKYNVRQQEVLKNIAVIYDKKQDITKKIYENLKMYILETYFSYEEFFKGKEENYLTSLNATLDKENAFLSKNKDYLYRLAKLDKESIKIARKETNQAYKETLKNLNNKYKEDLELATTHKEDKKKEYQAQKESIKVSLKIADSKKATELKEVLKLYKKEIKVNYKEEVKDAKKALKSNKKIAVNEYNLSLASKIKPQPIAIEYGYEVKKEEDRKIEEKQWKKLNKSLRKEVRVAKYRKNMNTQRRESLLGYLFLAVWAIGFIAMTLIPILYTIILSFSSVKYTNDGYPKVIDFSFTKGITFPSWTGRENFDTLFLTDVNIIYGYVPQFFRSLLLFVPIVVFISFVLALLLNTKIKGRTFFRIIYFLPVVIISGPVLNMLNNSNSSGSSSIKINLAGSSIATILESISPKLYTYANEIFQNFIIILWMTGVPIVLFISALQKINRSLYEAAEIDGANGWQKLWTITFPLIKSVLLICCLFTIMQVTTINVDYVNPFTKWLDNSISDISVNKGYVALAAWTQTIIVLLFVVVAFLLFREKEFVVKQKSYEEYEAIKKKKEIRRAKASSFFHVAETKAFFGKITSPITKFVKVRSQKRKEKKELGGK